MLLHRSFISCRDSVVLGGGIPCIDWRHISESGGGIDCVRQERRDLRHWAPTSTTRWDMLASREASILTGSALVNTHAAK